LIGFDGAFPVPAVWIEEVRDVSRVQAANRIGLHIPLAKVFPTATVSTIEEALQDIREGKLPDHQIRREPSMPAIPFGKGWIATSR
jgi:hypothetical protein